MTRLRRVDCSGPGFRRRRAGRGFVYLDASGRRIGDPAVRERVRALAIPPAWEDVWICTDPQGHIQAVGTDARGRRQYRYHDVWRQRRDLEKFDHMLEFARALPALRQIATGHLDGNELTRQRVLALAIRLLDLGSFRVGGEAYTAQNNTFGLATIQRRHVTLTDRAAVFDYMAKGGKRRVQAVADPQVRAAVEELKRRRGGPTELLAWRNGSQWVDVRSSDINSYLKQISAGNFSAKDFRTWNATVLAAVALASAEPAASAVARRRGVAAAIRDVSGYIGNTPAVCRRSYVDPRVVDQYLHGTTIAAVLEDLEENDDDLAAEAHPAALALGPVELAVIDLLDDASPLEQAA